MPREADLLRHAQLEGVAGEHLDLRLGAHGAQDADLLDHALGAGDGHALLRGELSGLAEVLDARQLEVGPEQLVEVRLREVDVAARDAHGNDVGVDVRRAVGAQQALEVALAPDSLVESGRDDALELLGGQRRRAALLLVMACMGLCVGLLRTRLVALVRRGALLQAHAHLVSEVDGLGGHDGVVIDVDVLVPVLGGDHVLRAHKSLHAVLLSEKQIALLLTDSRLRR